MNISGQAFDTLGALLHLLADPKAYEQQLTTLRKAIDENKKYVELIAPAGEIMNLLESQRKQTTAADKHLQDIKADAQTTRAAAAAQAEKIRQEAKDEAAKIVADAQVIAAEARAALEEAKAEKSAIAEAKKAALAHGTETAKLNAARIKLEEATKAANQVRADVEALRSELTAKLDKLRDL